MYVLFGGLFHLNNSLRRYGAFRTSDDAFIGDGMNTIEVKLYTYLVFIIWNWNVVTRKDNDA